MRTSVPFLAVLAFFGISAMIGALQMVKPLPRIELDEDLPRTVTLWRFPMN